MRVVYVGVERRENRLPMVVGRFCNRFVSAFCLMIVDHDDGSDNVPSFDSGFEI